MLTVISIDNPFHSQRLQEYIHILRPSTATPSFRGLPISTMRNLGIHSVGLRMNAVSESQGICPGEV
jgi:hypothetical protein